MLAAPLCVLTSPLLCVLMGGGWSPCGHPVAGSTCVNSIPFWPVSLRPPSDSKCVNSTPLCVNRGGGQCACDHPATVSVLPAPLCVLTGVAASVPVATQRQHSTTEYLPGMLHSNCAPGLLPKFPSWALCCLDTANFYNHQHGMPTSSSS